MAKLVMILLGTGENFIRFEAKYFLFINCDIESILCLAAFAIQINFSLVIVGLYFCFFRVKNDGLIDFMINSKRLDAS